MSIETKQTSSETTISNIAPIIKYHRVRCEMSMQKLASAVGVTTTQIFDLEHGKSCNPTLKTLLGLCGAFSITLQNLVFGEQI